MTDSLMAAELGAIGLGDAPPLPRAARWLLLESRQAHTAALRAGFYASCLVQPALEGEAPEDLCAALLMG